MRKLILLAILIISLSSLVSALTNDNVENYWYLNETSSPYVEVVQGNDLSGGTDPTRADGINTYGQYFDRSSQEYLPSTQDAVVWQLTTPFSVSLWLNMTSTGSNDYIAYAAQRQNTYNNGYIYLVYYGASDTFAINIEGDSNSNSQSCSVGAGGGWDNEVMHNIVYVHNSTDLSQSSVYIDGTRYTCDVSGLSGTYIIGNGNYDRFILGSYMPSYSEGWEGTMDELSTWNTSLNQQQITDLYNSGTGKFYPFTTPAPPATDSINISSPLPTNNSVFKVDTVAFNLTANSSFAFNATLYIDGVANLTNQYNAGSDVFVNFTQTFADADYKYIIQADNGNLSKNTTAFDFRIDTIDPDIVAEDNLAAGTLVTLNSLNTSIDYFNINLQTINITLNDNQIFYNGSVGLANFSVNVSEDMTGYSSGLQYLWTEACDPLNCVNITYNFTKVNLTTQFESQVIEEENNSFVLIVNSSNFTQISDINATLNYNNTEYFVDGTFTGEHYLFNTTVLAPFLGAINESKSFYWDILANTDNFNSSTESQTVFQLNITDCSYGVPTLNFTVKDATTLALLTNSTFNGYFTLASPLVTYERDVIINSTGKASHEVCIYPSFGQYTTDAQIEYGSSGYATSLHYLTNHAINSTVEDIDLLLQAGTSVVTFTVLDENDNPLEGAYIQVLNYDIGTDTYTTTQILQTAGGLGQAFGNLILNTEYYKFIIIYDSKIVLETTPTIITGTARTFQVNLYGDYYATYNVALGVANTLTFTNATKTFDFTFSDPTGGMHQACLRLVERSFKADTVINDTCKTSTAGTILQTIPGDTTGKTYIATSYLKFDELFVLQTLTESFKDGFKKFALDGMFVTFLMVLLLGLVGVWNPAVGGLLAFLGLFVAVVLGIFEVAQPILWGMAILAGITILRLNKN
tara:strand:- start:855 stop:3605 length:2751 start_codon:yes stop_codon:yes gene_type:complete